LVHNHLERCLARPKTAAVMIADDLSGTSTTKQKLQSYEFTPLGDGLARDISKRSHPSDEIDQAGQNVEIGRCEAGATRRAPQRLLIMDGSGTK